MKNKALFLDRDGVINFDPGDYCYSLEEFKLLPTVLPALQLAQEKGYLLIVITNQGGIAKSLYTEETVREIHRFFLSECEKAGITITAIYFSAHHPEIGNSLSRKPGSLMVERALSRYRVDPAKSVMIGDRERDKECAEGAGVRGIVIPMNSDLIDYVKELD
jgi:D-glycero-D-manno-heptose 1,7-bisphosphate phosphatase